MRFGCCAPKEDVDAGRQALQANGESEMQIIYDQPQSISPPRVEPMHYARPSTSHSMRRHVSQWVDTSRDFATRASSRASFSTLTRPRRSHSTRARPSIGRPTNFQHFDNGLNLDGIHSMFEDAPLPIRRNRSFRRLELSIYLPDGCGRLSPLPDFDDDETWGLTKVDLERPAQALVRVRDSRTNSMASDGSEYRIQRKPVASTLASVSHSRHSSIQSQLSYGTSATHERRLSGTTMNTMQTPLLSTWTEEPKASSDSILEKPTIRRSNTSGTLSPARVLSRLPSPSRCRANTAPSRPGSLRRTKTDVDDAIRELNTIVEERRASAYRSQAHSPALINRPPPSPSHHVPSIAPSMRMHVRSETLSDIGSAFSAPLSSNKSSPTTFNTTRRRTTGLTLAPPSRDSTMALCSNPVTPPAPNSPNKSMSRLTTWLRRSISASTTPTSPSAPKSSSSTEPFYRRDPPTSASRPSTATSNTTYHARQDSTESNSTATVTLFSASSVTSRAASPDFSTVPTKSPARKTKRVPAPLTLVKELAIEAPLRSGRSIRDLKPPVSPNVNLLRGMEIVAKDVGMTMPSPGAVGVAF